MGDEQGGLRITLAVTAGPHEGRAFTFTGHDVFIVGRSKRAHFQLPSKDRYFSRIHFIVEVNPPRCRLVDSGSRNGTYVNGQKVSAADLKDGDEIKAGRTFLRVSIEGGPPPEVPPAPAAASPAEIAEMPTLDTPAPRPPQLLPAGADHKPCPACGAIASAGEPPFPSSHPDLQRLGVCNACQAVIRRQRQRVPGYWLVRELGRGGMGVVSLALRAADGARLAVKTITPAVTASDRDISLSSSVFARA